MLHRTGSPTPGPEPIMRRAFAGGRAARHRRRRARLLGALLRASPTAPSRWPTRCSRAWSSAALLGLPLLLGGAVGHRSSPRWRSPLAARTPAIGRDTAVAVVVTTLFGLGALLALVAGSAGRARRSCCSATCSASRDGDLALAAALVAVVVVGALALLHGRLLVVGFDRTSARARSACAPGAGRRRAARAARRGACSSPCRAWATCSSSPCSSPRPRPRAC